MPPLSSTLASLFEVEILQDTYKPPDFLVEENWGCVIVDEDPTGTYVPTQYVCPGKISHTSDCGDWDLGCLVKGFGESLADLGNYVIFGINAYKDEIASDLASVICSDNQTCENAVGKAVDYGVAALTGLPPDLPNFEDLVSKNITSLIVTYVAGIDDPTLNIICDSACQDTIGAKLISRLKQGKSLQSQPACMYGYDAYFHGQQPACLDPSIVVHPAPGASNQPAFVEVKLTRKTTPESLAVQKEAMDQYRLEVSVQGEKLNPNYQQAVVGPLYQPVRLTIPWIEPGQSLILPIVLQQNYQMVQGTTVDKTSKVTVNTASLFPGGTSHMRATESCYSANSTWEWVPCTGGGVDQWDFANP
jgi:hypothetical protein